MVRKLVTQDNVFLAFNEKTQTFVRFRCRVSEERLAIEDFEMVTFAPGPDILGLNAFSKPEYFGLHPNFAVADNRKLLMVVDYELVKQEDATGNVSEE